MIGNKWCLKFPANFSFKCCVSVIVWQTRQPQSCHLASYGASLASFCLQNSNLASRSQNEDASQFLAFLASFAKFHNFVKNSDISRYSRLNFCGISSEYGKIFAPSAHFLLWVQGNVHLNASMLPFAIKINIFPFEVLSCVKVQFSTKIIPCQET